MRYRSARRLFLFLFDSLLIFLSLYLTLFLRRGDRPLLDDFWGFAQNFIWLFLFWLFLLFSFDFYSLKLRTGTFQFFRYFFIFIFLSFFSGILYFYLQPNLAIAPKTILFLELLIFSLLFLLWRFLFDWLFRKNIRREKIIFLGTSPEVNELKSYLDSFSSRYRVEGAYPLNYDIQKMKEAIKKERIRKIIVAEPSSDEEKSADSFNLRELLFSFPGLEIESFIKFYETNTQKIPLSFLSNPNFLAEFYKEEERTYVISKRIFDTLFSLFGFLFLAVFYPFVAVAIK